ncbi:DUF885 domain-containing protein [Cognatiluteimonas telluris]|uniref:DUF885 domain-containing protein n=1 Tax=Cognatiluteimonas telluris TaxID=1104775 RepID=UPI00140A1405|nr:DUF885 domain-containing protein [Lysobacter telluris]
MRPSLLAAALLTAVVAGCQSMPASTVASSAAAPAGAPMTSSADARFADLSRRWLDGWMQLNPITATQLGDHRFDNEVDDLSADGRQRMVDFSQALLAELDAMDPARLSRENQVDAAILRNQLRSDIWNMQTFQSWVWDPQVYNSLAGGAIYNTMARDYAPLPQRLKAATVRMEKIPGIFAQMRANLDPARVPAIHAETVAKQNAGILSLVDEFITPNAAQLTGADRSRLDAAVAGLRKAVADNQAWLDTSLVPNAKGDFRIGQKLYDEKLRFSLDSALSRQEIKQRAQAELTRVRGEMYDIARGVLKGKPHAPPTPAAPTDAQQQKAIEAALELAYVQHPARSDVVDAAKQALVKATAFVRDKDLVTVPNDPVKVILMPEFQRGVAVAYCDSPGPLDKGLDTYFAISPIPDDWTDAQAESFLREYNSRMIQLLTIHEAMPGHYLEGAHSAQFPSTLRAVLRSGLFAEGWAVYTENMMTQAGYMDSDPLFRLVQLKFYLRTIANAILDQGVHVDGWSREQAMQLMTQQAFQQEREAAGKWVRAQLSSAQLPTYFVGVQEQYDLRRAMEARLGDRFNLKAYHDRVLSYGAPPTRYVHELMLDEPIR